MNDAVKNSTVYEKNSDEEAASDTRTFSYISEEQENEDDDDELSEPEIAASIENNRRGAGRYDLVKRMKEQDGTAKIIEPESNKLNRRRQLKELAKFHARDIISFKINKKLAEQAAIAQQNAAQTAVLSEKRKLDFADLVDSDFDLSWVIGSERFKYKHKTEPTIQPTDPKLVAEF